MQSPIQRRGGRLRIRVSDMQRTIRWCSAFFGLPLAEINPRCDTVARESR